MNKITGKTWVSVGTLVAAIGLTVSIVRALDAPDAKIEAVRANVIALDDRLKELNSRQDTADDRWVKVLEDLSAIKQKLGIVEDRQTFGRTK